MDTFATLAPSALSTAKTRVREKLASPYEGTVLLNEDPEILSHSAADYFAAAVELQIDDGYGFVPFVGAGLSSPSGVPLIVDIKPYLQRCIAMALGVDGDQPRPWNPRRDQWPSFHAEKHSEETKWRHRIQEKIDRETRDDPWDRDLFVMQEALGAMAEWRTALQFLSRIDHDERGSDWRKRIGFVLDQPRQEVIDACLRTVLKGKYPTLGHRMLAALGGLLRLNVVLTTNFDDLLELAFAAARNPLTVFEVHLGSDLPAWSAIGAHRSLIKLHGNRHSLRADYTLDAPPSAKDLERFVDYLVAGETRPRTDKSGCSDAYVRNHLLVVGASAAERRTSAFIRHAWQCDLGLKVFWICHTPQDVLRVRELTRACESTCTTSDSPWLGSVVVRHTNPGLLFLQMFQSIRHTVPSGGIVFPATSRLSIPPLASSALDQVSDGIRRSSESSFGQWLTDVLEGLVQGGQSGAPRLLAVTSEKHADGLTSVCASVFEEMESKAACIWIDLNDVSNTDDLFEQLLDAMYFYLGAESWLPVFIAEDAASRADEIRRVAGMTARPWIVFLNARETPGSNRPKRASGNVEPPNGWIDMGGDSGGDTANRVALVSLLTQLCPSNAASPSISVVLLCRSADSGGRKGSSAVGDELESRGLVREVCVWPETIGDLNPQNVAERCTKWMNEDSHEAEARRRFVHRLVLMQRTRFLSCIWMRTFREGEGADCAWDNGKHEEWIAELGKKGLVRRKLGGFIWLHTRSRDELRRVLSGRSTELGDLHWELASWYYRILLASGSPHALFEGIYHACRSAEACWPMGTDEARMDACMRIGWATDILRQNSFLVQTIGYSRGSCRRLESIRDELCGLVLNGTDEDCHSDHWTRRATAVKRLRIACTELLRAIAREVGEVRRAYQRHRELRALIVVDDPNARDEDGLKEKMKQLCVAPETCRSFSPAIELLRWWKWCGMLGIASRSYDLARDALLTGLRTAEENGRRTLENAKEPFSDRTKGSDCDYVAYNALDGLVNQCRYERHQLFGAEYSSGDSARLRLEILRMAEQYIACRLQQHNAELRCRGVGPIDLERISNCTNLALRIGDSISGGPDEGGTAALFALCKSRLHLHRGHIASFRGEHRASMNAFTDAEAALNLCELRRFDSDRAVVELYRAEARLSEAESVSVKQKTGETLRFRSLTDEVVRAAEGTTDLFSVLRTLVPDDSSSQEVLGPLFRRASAVGRDAIRFLDRAEDIFARRRRNSAITTWYFHRRLRSISVAVWASLMDRGGPIPFLGVEAAPEGTETIADQLVAQAVRLIRADVYRLATIVDEYSRCAIAMRARLVRDRDVPRLTQRQQDMCATLEQAVSKLKQVFEIRTSRAVPNKYEERTVVSGDIKIYYTDLVARCAARLKQLKHIVT